MNDADKSAVIARLFATIVARQGDDATTSYTAKLFAAGRNKIAAKVAEEAGETVIAGISETGERLASESADLLYHLMVLWADAGITPADVFAELERREGTSGITEKASRSSGD